MDLEERDKKIRKSIADLVILVDSGFQHAYSPCVIPCPLDELLCKAFN
jgi:hypothetical protein